jgi:hypothetical protein
MLKVAQALTWGQRQKKTEEEGGGPGRFFQAIFFHRQLFGH